MFSVVQNYVLLMQNTRLSDDTFTLDEVEDIVAAVTEVRITCHRDSAGI